jgi:EAL and modified HD-GYP domain-containing signal transduction protein
MGEDKPQELIVLPLVRARFCELLAPSAHLAAVSNDLFLLGLLSAIDAILDMRMEDVLKEIAIRAEIREALLGAPNPLREVFDLALQYEKGSWEGIDEAAAHLTVEAEAISSAFVEAVGWANGILTSQPSEASETKAPARKT